MNTFKKIGAGILASVIAMSSLTACQDYDAPKLDAPVATLQANTTILELKQIFWDDATNYIWGTEQKEDATPVAIPAREDGTHYVIKGTVVSSDEAGNVFKSLVIQDPTAALAISINSYNLYLKYRRGQEVLIDVTGMYIGKYNGLLQLGAPEWYANGNAWEASFMAPETFSAHVELNGWPEVSAIDTINVNTFSELSSDLDGLQKWQSQLVKLNNVSFVNGGVETYSEYHSSGVNQSITDSEGNSLIVRTSGYSNFWNQKLPVGNFDLVCIASYYGTTGWQLIMIDADGVMNLGNPTEAPGTESKPLTVDEAITQIAAGYTPNAWVTGYIVGTVAPEVTSVTSNSDIEWTDTPILGNTLVIGQTADTKDIANALVMELTPGSRLYALGNLVDNPSNYGKQIWIKGTMSKYLDTFGVVGNTGTSGTWKIEGVEDNSAITDGDGTQASPYSANQVIAMAKTDASLAWVTGYIVGSSPGMSASDFVPGAAGASGTNIFIANSPEETDYLKCVPVQLPTGSVRAALNLSANPGMLGARVSLYGTLEKYFGQSGLKNVTEYSVDGEGTGGEVTPPVTGGNGSESSPFSCADVIAMNPQSSDPVASGVWTKGYIVGWANMASVYYINDETATFSVPATMATNILLADTPTATSYTQCIGVQLPSGAVRTALNLQNNPGNLGKQVLIKGDIAKYSGVAGIRSASDYKLDGQSSGGGDTPSTPSVVTSLNEKFSSGAIPSGWTQKQVAGTKAWYVTSFSGVYYAAMTGYQGTAPFDSWLVTPGLDLDKMTNKVLTFETEVNGYQSTTTQFEVYVMDTNDPATANTTRLNVNLPAAPASGYSSWTPSGNIDLGTYSGTVYIGYRYYATTDANYATWCLTNVMINSDGTTTPDVPSTGAGSESEPYTCNEVIGGTGVGTTAWVGGYIVGSSNGMSGSDFAPGVADPSNTNIFIATSATETDYTKCVPVQLPTGDVRTALSLQQHPENLGKFVKVYGSIEKYFGQNGVKSVTKYSFDGSSSGGGDNPGGDTPDVPSGDYKGDFNSFNGGTPKSSYATYTNATGWTAVNSAILSGTTDASANNPYFTFIGGAGVLAPTLNGKLGNEGVLTSPVLTGGIGTLTFNYGFAFAETKCSFTITVKGTDGSVIKTDTVTLESIEQKKAYDYSLEVNHTGDFTIEIVNNAISQATGNKDRVSIWNLTWTN